MKKIILSAVAVFSMQMAFAQNSAVNNAILNEKSGTLDKAKTEIDKAITHEKTQGLAKTWYTRGTVHEALIGHPIYGNLEPNAIQIALESYDKAIELGQNEKKAEKFVKDATDRKQNLYGHALNKGVELYNDQNFDGAIEAYDIASKINPQDTTAYMYAAYAAAGKQDYQQVKNYYNKLLGIGHRPVSLYKNLIFIAKNVDNDEKEQLRLLSEARKEHPEDKDLMLEELSLYVNSGKSEEAVGKLKDAIKMDPQNANLYSVLGTIQDQSGDITAAAASYKKALEIDPNNFDALFNLGVQEFNQAAALFNQANKMDYATYQKQGKKIETEAKAVFKRALPYFESAHKIQPSDRATIQSLQKIYTTLGNKDEAKKMDDLLTASEAK
jgi:tetratricopeptide (TPR) repeat protein